MTATAQDLEFIEKVAALTRAAPNEWNAFMAEMASYVARQKDACVLARPEIFQIVQGQARESASLHELFRDAVKTADRVQDKR